MPVRDTVVPASVPDVMPYVNVSPESESAPTRTPVAFAKVSTAMVSTNDAVVGEAKVGALFKLIDRVALVGFPLPTASVNAPLKTDNVAAPVALADTVNVAVYEVPEPLSADRVPPTTVTSLETKFVDGSDSVKVMVSDAP